MKASQRQEKRVAMRTSGKVQPGSGSGYMRKGDVRSFLQLIECKTTTKQSYSLKRAVLDKIEKEALLDGRDFVLALEIDGREYAVMAFDYFQTLTERLYFQELEVDV